MKNSTGGSLVYGLFVDSARTIPFGDVKNWFVRIDEATPTLTATGESQKISVYGGLSKGQYVKGGDYASTLTVRLDY